MKKFTCLLFGFSLAVGAAARVTAQTASSTAQPPTAQSSTAQSSTPQTPATEPSTSSPSTGASTEKLPDFSGTWTLDRSLSNDPAQVNFGGAPVQQNQGNRRRGGFGGFGGLGGFGGGGGGRGSNNTSNSSASGTSDERARLTALTDELKKASATLVISHHDPSFVVNDALDHTLFFNTTASREDHTLGDVTFSSTSHWEGDRIVVEYAISSRRTLVYTYTLLPKTNQMVLRVRPQFNDGTNASELKLVYTLTPSQTAQGSTQGK
jgi:hypothetical protein